MEQKAEVLSRRMTCKLVGLSTATIWRLECKSKFPRRIKLSEGRVGYLRQDVEEWLSSRPRLK